ncbi:MAG: CFI-box-CTERM domain-containing protein [Polyangiales bacterium]
MRILRHLFAMIVLTMVVFRPSFASADRRLEIEFTPTERAQIAIWIETESGEFVDTVLLTEAVGLRGIGNRPGAMQMNSGYHWPYGRREGVLPIWAHRRSEQIGADLFPMVIFQDRVSEGYASRTTVDASVDSYFCLSFDKATTKREALDAVTCASVFNSDKGRYLRTTDLQNNYAEPFVDDQGTNTERALPLHSLYPPRRDVSVFELTDHFDVRSFNADARRIMPNIDAITTATPVGDARKLVFYAVDDAISDGDYRIWLEIGVEGDYNNFYNDELYPTPMSEAWDSWAETYGYPYRGQPSVVYSVPIRISSSAATGSTRMPTGYSDMHGLSGAVNAVDETITDDPDGAPGSGVDRLRENAQGARLVVRVTATEVCASDNPPPECSKLCASDGDCTGDFLCGPTQSCVGRCDVDSAPAPLSEFTLKNHPDKKLSHRLAQLSFTIPESRRELRQFAFKNSREPIDEVNWFIGEDLRVPKIVDGKEQAIPTDPVAIPSNFECERDRSEPICADYLADAEGNCPHGVDNDHDGDCLDAGDSVHLDVAFYAHETLYYVAARAIDECQSVGSMVEASVTTTAIHFTTVDPCFIATAAYGSPFAAQIGSLRAFRDQILMRSSLGRNAIAAYYIFSPSIAEFISERPWLATLTRTALEPVVALARWATDESQRSSRSASRSRSF